MTPRLPGPGLERRRPARAPRGGGRGAAGARRRRPGAPPRCTRPSRSAWCSTSASSSTPACASRRRTGRTSCSTRARRSSASWGARPAACATARAPIDVDVLMLDELEYRSERLTLPHPEVSSRRFVLVPLLELDPDLALPGRRAPGRRARRARSRARTSGASGAARCSRPRRLGFAHAAGRRRRQHPNALRRVPRRRGRRSSEHWRFATVRESTGDELGAALSNLLGAARPGVRRRRAVDRLLDRAAAVRAVDADGRALPRPRDAGRRPVDPDRDADPVSTTRTRSAPTGWSTRWRRTTASTDTCVVVDFGTAITYDAVSAAGEYLGGIITPGRGDLDRRAVRPRRQAPEGRARRAARADRQVDRRRDPQRDRVRVRRSGRGDRPPAARRARRRART